jgi:hypothetical protein
MKKLAIGCLAVLLVVLVVGGTLGYYFIIRPAGSYIASFRQLAEVADIEKQVSNTRPFSPPASGELSEQMVTRFVAVQERMSSDLGGRFDELKDKYEQIERRHGAAGREASVSEKLEALKDLATIVVDAKKAQVAALNAANFSIAEYDWVRSQVYGAAGLALSGIDLKELSRMATERGSAEIDRAALALSEIPERNRDLVQPYVARLQEWAALAFFGL